MKTVSVIASKDATQTSNSVQPMTSSTSSRSAFLDAIRAIATIRVVVWHAYGAPLISWCIAAMPAMFFVFGSLLAASLSHRRFVRVANDRLKRLLIPLWWFTTIAWVGVNLAGKAESFNAWQLLSWLIPITDPIATTWEGGWLSSPLWFLRMVIWLLVLVPALMPLGRRWPRATIGTLAMLIFAFDALEREAYWTPQHMPMLWWKLGDVALYGLFAVVGFCHHRGQLGRISTRRWILIAATAGVVAVVWRITHVVPLGVVNNSHPLHLFVGVAWLAAAFAAQSQIGAFAQQAAVQSAIRFLTRRSLTIYLWHTAVIVGVIWLLEKLNPLVGAFHFVAYPTLIGCGIVVSTLLFGWVEDVGAGRLPSLHVPVVRLPKHRFTRPTAGLVLVAVIGVGGAHGVSATTSQRPIHKPPPIPSQQPPPPVFTRDRATPSEIPVVAADKVDATLKKEIHEWRLAHDASGVSVRVVTTNGTAWGAVDGTQLDGRTALQPDDSFDIASITKLMTAVLVYRAADEGRIDLDAPLPHLAAFPEFPYNDALTPRMLLSHRSGLVNYRDTARYASDSSAITTPQQAVEISTSEPLGFQPGTEQHYSSVNYLVLGFLIEQTYGAAYEEVLRKDLLIPLRLTQTIPMPASPGEPSYSTAGTLTTMSDLTTMTRHLLGDRALISQGSFAAMTDIDADTGLGAGTIGFCPCSVDDRAQKSFFSLGHYGTDTLAVYVPTLDATVAVRVTDGIHSDGRIESLVDLVAYVAQLAAMATD